MSAPTPKQLSYLNSLITRTGMTQEQWRTSVGLYETSPWGKRLRTEMITRARVSIWIDALRTNLTSGTTDAPSAETGVGTGQGDAAGMPLCGSDSDSPESADAFECRYNTGGCGPCGGEFCADGTCGTCKSVTRKGQGS